MAFCCFIPSTLSPLLPLLRGLLVKGITHPSTERQAANQLEDFPVKAMHSRQRMSSRRACEGAPHMLELANAMSKLKYVPLT